MGEIGLRFQMTKLYFFFSLKIMNWPLAKDSDLGMAGNIVTMMRM